MHAMAILQIATWGAKAIAAIVAVIADAINGPEPPTLDELRKKVQGAIDAHHEDWIKAARDDADKALVEAADREYSDESKKL